MEAEETKKGAVTTEQALAKVEKAARKKHPLIQMFQVAAVLGVSPTMKREDVARQMTRKYHGAPSEDRSNIAVDFANDNRATALLSFEKRFRRETRKCEIDDKICQATVTLVEGAADKGSGLAFIRIPFGQRAAASKEDFKSLDDQPHMFAQMQIEMYLARVTWGVFYQWSPLSSTFTMVELDVAWLQGASADLCAFYLEYKSDHSKNKEHLEPLRRSIDNAQVRKLMQEIDDLDVAMGNAKSRKDEILAEFKVMARDKSVTIAGRNFTRTESKGSVAYAEVVKKLLPDTDLEQYRGKPSISWKLS